MAHGGHAGGILSIPDQEVSLGSLRVGAIHAQAPTPLRPPLLAFLADFSQQPKGQTCFICTQALQMRWTFAKLYVNDSAKLDDIREAVTTLEDVERRARRVFGGAHPLTTAIGRDLRRVQALREIV